MATVSNLFPSKWQSWVITAVCEDPFSALSQLKETMSMQVIVTIVVYKSFMSLLNEKCRTCFDKSNLQWKGKFLQISMGFELPRDISIAKYVKGNEYSSTQEEINVKRFRVTEV